MAQLLVQMVAQKLAENRPLGVMVTKNSKGRQKFLGTDIKNLHMQKLRLAAVYRRAKFHDDTTTFTNIKPTFSKRHCPP